MGSPSTPGIVGYRNLTDQDKASMNAVKATENTVGELLQSIRGIPGVDQVLCTRAAESLQVGFMLLVRSIAQPASKLMP